MAGLVAGGVALGAIGAEASTLWRWQTEDGSVAYADDEKRIPERYRARAEAVTPESLSDMGRITTLDASATQAYSEQLAARLAALRAAAASDQDSGRLAAGGAVAHQPVPAHPASELALRSLRETDGRRFAGYGPDGRPRWRRTTQTRMVDAPTPTLALDVDPSDPSPVLVERMRVRAGDSITTEHVTVVRQGDRVLSVVRSRDAQSSADWPRLEDLTR
jgi:hypothetical protein